MGNGGEWGRIDREWWRMVGNGGDGWGMVGDGWRIVVNL